MWLWPNINYLILTPARLRAESKCEDATLPLSLLGYYAEVIRELDLQTRWIRCIRIHPQHSVM